MSLDERIKEHLEIRKLLREIEDSPASNLNWRSSRKLKKLVQFGASQNDLTMLVNIFTLKRLLLYLKDVNSEADLEQLKELAAIESIAEFDVVRKIGEGSYKRVYLAECYDTPGVNYALLVVDLDNLSQKARHYLQKLGKNIREICSSEATRLIKLGELNNPHVPKVFSAPKISHNRFYWWAEEYVPGKLSEIIVPGEKLAPQHVAIFLLQIAKGLRAAHKAGIFHGDIGPENIGFVSSTVKILDWGLSSTIPEEFDKKTGREFLGYRLSRAPEVYEGAMPTDKSDIWALGVLGYRLLTGEYPFKWSFTGTKEEWSKLDISEKQKYEAEIKMQVLDETTYPKMPETFDEKAYKKTCLEDNPDSTQIIITKLRNIYNAVYACLKRDPSQRASIDVFFDIEATMAAPRDWFDDSPVQISENKEVDTNRLFAIETIGSIDYTLNWNKQNDKKGRTGLSGFSFISK